MQETWVWSMVSKDRTCCRTTHPSHHNYWVCSSPEAATTEPMYGSYRGLCAQSPGSTAREVTAMKARHHSQRADPALHNWSEPVCSCEDPAQPKINKIKKKKESPFQCRGHRLNPWLGTLTSHMLWGGWVRTPQLEKAACWNTDPAPPKVLK